MPGIFSYGPATHPAMVTGGADGPAADRGHAAPLPSAQAPANSLLLACEAGPVARRGESRAFGRIGS